MLVEHEARFTGDVLSKTRTKEETGYRVRRPIIANET